MYSVYRNSGKNYAELAMGSSDAGGCTAWVKCKVGTTALRDLAARLLRAADHIDANPAPTEQGGA